MVANPLTRLRAISWGQVFRETIRATYRHDCTDAAAAMAFDFVFAIFPCLLVLTALLVVTGISPHAFTELLIGLGIVIPAPILQAMEENIQHLWNAYQSLFFFGILGVIFPASASMSTTMSALNRAYGAEEKRPFWKRRLLSVFLVVSLGLSLIFLFGLVVFGEQLEVWLRSKWEVMGVLPSLIGVLRRVIGFLATLLVAGAIYRLAPDAKQRWLDVLPGSLLFLVTWSLIAAGFRQFISSFSYYEVVSGLLGGVIVLLLCAYLIAFTLLMGGELNGVLHRRRDQVQSTPTD